jgi:hypothetical protein
MKYIKKFDSFEQDNYPKQMKGIIKYEPGNPYILGDDNKEYSFGMITNITDEYPKVGDLDTTEIDGQGSWSRKYIKPYIGMVVRFVVSKNGYGYNYTIFKDDN